MKPIVMLGTAAYSPFRLDAIRAALGARVPSLAAAEIDARWVYAIQCAKAAGVDASALARAGVLLNAAPDTALAAPADPDTTSVFYVTPRLGTISPWSSKATDIFRNCGLSGIARVERGIRFVLRVAGTEVPYAVVQPALPALYDRMTEGVYLSLNNLFDTPEPRPGRTFDVLARGVDAIREANTSLGLAISEPEMQ